ncbi:MAG TPA: DNA gyrase subunit A [Candidatus Methanoculleus thermohydrogenotrophicum]|nr:DNA gyrase subunit A [Candidatus Methanoculleus thermohydrogenotrophicum]NLM81337.1 DNA gyrase subunit A [Candidatus Methanoculleus thermohydrogenotrophicum]HOB18018.1 DNA gyrase subunit A [Candidatus Methanoculleus thermohydrogenotrophicum]HPZ38156.1 DNA gyrase subunit A [Candidatus Methanoculleus thermohydrogenotrophicum]HQC91028.1 DNA gyrase subunit A [Candidatus Methanoculleus thermohydrogenotrophicum]
MTSEGVVSEEVIPVNIEDEMKSCYIDYAMSVIIGRAIPDVRDGLKPVHRRTLYAMWEMGNTSDKPYKKSARVVGDVMGKYHPHGDSAIYDTLVKMAQPFTYRYTLVDGQGNFGSIDGDSAAAMRYTEVRLTKLSEELLADINKETVDFVSNFDESLQEPDVLPARVPNLLVNGSSGIAVGMATNMPPHNLKEVCKAICRIIDEPGVSTEELMQIMPGPDFPTGGIIMGTKGIRDAYLTGRGKCVIRGVAEIDEEGRTPQIIITEIPFQVNKARLIEHIADLVRDKKIEGITDIRDESDRDGMRIVIDLKKGTAPQVVLNYLYKHTALESTFGIINLAIVDRQPRTLNLKELIHEFLKHRVEVVRRRTEFDLRKAEERMHILRGLLVALDNIDAVVATIRASRTTEEAEKALVAKFALDEVQADAILKMQLRRLAALEQQKILDEHDALAEEVKRLNAILASEASILAEIRKELVEISSRYGDERRTRIGRAAEAIEIEDLIEDRPMLVSLTSSNYIKRIDLDTYRNQRRGGRGVIGMATKEDDGVENVFVANMHDYLLCFTDKGRVYWLKVYDLPEGQRTSKGKAVVNLLNLDGDERVTTMIPVREFSSDHYLFFATKGGTVAKMALDEFSRPRQTGINAINLRDGDELVDVKATDGNQELILTTRFGQSLRFHEEAVRVVRRNAMGVRGIRLRHGDTLQAVSVVEKDHLLTITEQGFGKRTEFEEFRGHGRGTLGVRNIVVDARAGGVVGSMAVSEDDEIIVMSASGIVIRTKVSEISIQKRNTRGVRIMKLDEGDRVIGFTILDSGERDEEEV